MARPEIQGLKYFPFDVGFYRDKKIKLLRADSGAEGIEVYQRLLCKCYEGDNGYYLSWDKEDDYALLADETGYSKEKIRLIVSTCIRRSLFDGKLFNVGNVLTSRGIQRRYFSAIKDTKMKAAAQGRHTMINEGLCLLTEEDFLELNKTCVWLKVAQNCGNSVINDSKSAINNGKSTINPAKEMKGNEIKVNKSNICPAAPSDIHKQSKFIKPSIDEIASYCIERNNRLDAQRIFDHYEANNWFRGKTKISDWRACVRTWEKNQSTSQGRQSQPKTAHDKKSTKNKFDNFDSREINFAEIERKERELQAKRYSDNVGTGGNG